MEKVYQNAMFIELLDMGLSVDKEMPLEVFYKGQKVGSYYADLVVEDEIIVEEKFGKTNPVNLVNPV
jgi:GxxExxY protein